MERELIPLFKLCSCCCVAVSCLCLFLVMRSVIMVYPYHTHLVSDTEYGFTDHSNAVLLLWIFFFFLSLPFVMSVYCSPVATCWEKFDLLALLCYFRFCHFPIWCPGSGLVLDCMDS